MTTRVLKRRGLLARLWVLGRKVEQSKCSWAASTPRLVRGVQTVSRRLQSSPRVA